MSTHQDGVVVSRYYVIKNHQWRGSLRRILVIGRQNVATHEVADYKLTNSYNCTEIRDFFPITSEEDQNTVTTGAEQSFSIYFPSAKMKFKSKHRSDILTDLFKVCTNFSQKYNESSKRYSALKHRWTGENVKVFVDVGVYSVTTTNPTTGLVLSTYYYKDIYKLANVKDVSQGSAFLIATTESEKYHLFIVNDDNVRRDIMDRIRLVARKNIGVVIPISNEAVTMQQFICKRLGYDVSSLAPLHNFLVLKVGAEHKGSPPKKRFLALTDQFLLERDANTNEIVNLRHLVDVYAIVRPKTDSQLFSVHYLNGDIRLYTSTERDIVLASLLDSVRTSGNANVHVKIELNHHKIISLPEVETVRYLHARTRELPIVHALDFFIQNSFVTPTTTLNNEPNRRERKEIDKFIQAAITELLIDDFNDATDEEFNKQLLALRHLFSTKPGFSFFVVDRRWKEREIELLFGKVKKALKRDNDIITFSAIDMLSTLMQPYYDESDLFFEQKNKGFLLSSERFLPILLELMEHHVAKGTGALVISAVLEFLIYALCAPYSETTDGGHFDMLLNLVAKSGRSLFKLFNHQSFSIVKSTCLLMKAIIEEGNSQVANRMQELSLAEGTFLFHLHASLFPIVSGDKFFPIQILSRKLLSLWTVSNETAISLLNAIFPLGLLNFLESTEKPPKDSMNAADSRDNLKIAQDLAYKPVSSIQKLRDNYPAVRMFERQIEDVFNHWRKRIGFTSANEITEDKQPVVLRRRRELIKSNQNWNMFFYQFTQNHAKPDLIWNHKTREELREALEKEIWQFNSDKELHATQLIAWNFSEFEINYASLGDEIKIGNYYLRLLLSQDNQIDQTETNLTNRLFIKNPYEFFNSLYHRFLSNSKLKMKADCLQAMSIIYGEYVDEIGPFNDMNFIEQILESCLNRILRDRIVQFMEKLTKNNINIKNMIASNGVHILIDLATLSHLHINRAVIPTQSNVIEASPEMMQGSNEKEWHIGDDTFSYSDLKELWKEGKITSETKCWAQGYNTWYKLGQIAQLKWSLVAEDTSIFQENDMTILILNVLIKLCEAYPSRLSDESIIRPMPKVKQILTHDSCLPHLVHLLLTFDPVIVEKVATLVYLIMKDNPRISLFYQTGIFYFILMYTGSNILPISRLLHLTHLKQSFKSEESNQSVLQRSILGQIIPEAMVCYLENYGPEDFSKVFLGEFDTPEVIWNSEMRRFMIERIAAHIVDFSPRLQSNVRAIYQYCPIPPVQYVQLENELFCNIYYLKNLCDTKRFNQWPIKEPVTLLKNILDIWKVEIEKKPNTMQLEDALDILGIKDYDGLLSGPPFESIIRKKYYAAAQLYHPDKNPNGRDMFEKVNEAYYFLCSGNHKSSGPDAQNIILILKGQSILFSRYGKELHQYKYAGYPMLLKTLKLEIDDQYLFSKSNPLLAHACKTVYHSVKCSALNAEELRREEGLEILYNILNRCVSVLSASSTSKDLATKVCKYIISCFGVSAEFPACRRYFYDMTLLPKNIFYILNYKHLIKLCMAAIDCIIYFCNDPYLQLLLFKSGIVFSLLQFIFKYDYTLEEADVETDGKTNRQCLSNSLAKNSLSTCVALFENKFNNAQIEDKSLLDDYSLIRQSLFALLTPYIANQLNNSNVPELLKILNSNVENPYFIWNNQSRAELINYLQEQEKELLRSGVAIDPSFGTQFVFSSHKEELIIGDIFVRIYNTQPSFAITDVKRFVIALLDHLGSHAQYLHAIKVVSFPKDDNATIDANRIDTMKQCIMALINLIKHNSGIETYFVGNFKNIFSFLRMDNHPDVQSLVLQLIMQLATNKECLNDISLSNVIIYLLLILNVSNKIVESKSKIYLDVIDILISFGSNNDLVKESISKGVLIYSLHIFCGPHFHLIREKAAQLMIKLCSDKLSGQYSKWVLAQLLPSLFLNAMKDAPKNAITLYDDNQENPELIWTDDSRTNLNQHLKEMIDELYALQVVNPFTTWKFSIDAESKLTTLSNGEFKIAGVYLHLYNQSPGWILSRPKDFMLGLMEYMKEKPNQPNINETEWDLVSTALCNLFSSQPNLLLLIPPTGYLQIFMKNVRTKNAIIVKAYLSVLLKFAGESVCVGDMIAANILADNLNYVLENHPDQSELTCDVLVKMFESGSNEFVNQAIQCDLIKRLLNILDSNASQSAKAKIVQMLQYIQNNPIMGPQIIEILSKSSIWNEYKDQKHDLFITSNQSTQFLTGPSVNIAGYLTQNASNTLPLVPPPIEE